jgi:hypothetical protein
MYEGDWAMFRNAVSATLCGLVTSTLATTIGLSITAIISS